MAQSGSIALYRDASTAAPASLRPKIGSDGAQSNPHPVLRCQFSLVATRAGFLDLEPQWRDLIDRTGKGHQIFQSFNWLWHWSNHFLADDDRNQRLAILTGWIDGTLCMIWPLVVQRCGGQKQLAWMGYPVSQYGDIIADRKRVNDDDLLAALAFLKEHTGADSLSLRKVRGDAVIAPVLRTYCGEPAARFVAPYLDLTGAENFDAYQAKYSAKARKNRRRLRRRVEERADLTVISVVDGVLRAKIAAAAVDLKRKWLRTRGLFSPAMQDSRTRAFFEDAAASITHPTGCRTTTMMIGSDVAAIELSFAAKGHCLVHVIVYNTEYEKAGAGVLLMEDAIEAAIRSDINTYDLMAPGDRFKLDWADGQVAVEDWKIGWTLRGRAVQALRLCQLQELAKAGLKALPLSLRRLLHLGFALKF